MAHASKADLAPFPARGVPGRWRDPWDDPELDTEWQRAGPAGSARPVEERPATIRATGDGGHGAAAVW